MIRFACICGRQLQADETQAGSRAVCPICDRIATVPAGEEFSPVVVASAVGSGSIPVLPGNVEPPPSEVRPRDHRARRRWLSGRGVLALLLSITFLCTCVPVIPDTPVDREVAYSLAAWDALMILMGLSAWRLIRAGQGGLTGGRIAGISLLIGVGGIVNQLILIPSLQEVRFATKRTLTSNNLKRVCLGMDAYASRTGKFPAACTRGPDGKPLLSWRVAILPLIEQAALYKQFHLDEPWDSPHNLKLLPQMPLVYSDGDRDCRDGLTRFMVYVGPPTVFEGNQGHAPAEVTDGASETVLVVQGEEWVPWTKPVDLPFGPEVVLVRPHKRGSGVSVYIVGTVDASVRGVPSDISDENLRALITRNGGEKVEWP